MNEDRLVAALVNATLQTAALSLCIAVVLRFAPRTSAAARCAIWTGALFVAVALPLVDFARIEHVSAPETVKTSSAASVGETRAAAVREPAAVAQVSPAAVRVSLATAIGRIAHIALYLWWAGIAFFALRLLYQIASLLRAKAEISPREAPEFLRVPRLRRRVALGVSDRIAVPCLLGLFRPVIALPQVLASDLSRDDIQRIVLHEAAHLERFDDWFNLFEQVALVFLFFNPALHYIARQIGMEREIACDDHVVAKSQNRVTYAECLAELARRCAGRRALTVPGFFTNRRQILVRVEQLLDRAHNGSPRIGRKAFAAVGMVTAAGFLLSQVGIPVVAAGICPLKLSPARPVTAPFAFAPFVPPAPVARVAHAARPAHVANVAHVVHVTPAPVVAARPVTVPRKVIAPRARVAAPAVAAVQATPMAAIAHAVNAVASAEASVRGQDASYSEGPSLSGYNGMSADEIIDLHDHGVDGKYIEGMKAAGYAGLSAQELIQLRDHDVSAAFATAMSALGAHRFKVSDLVNLRDHGVSPDYLAGLAQAGFGGLSADQMIRLRDHGVTASYIAHIRHDLNPSPLTIEELIKLRDAGI